MIQSRTLILLICLSVLSAFFFSFSNGPPAGSTGAPDEGTCADSGCHTGFTQNSGPGSLTLTGPTQYAPGDTFDFTINLSQTGQKRWGFELTALNSSNQSAGTILVTTPSRTKLLSAIGRQYLEHTSIGTNNGTIDASPGWNFQWVAPTIGAGQVTFYVAGNAANGNGLNQGDFIYTTSKPINEVTTSVTDDNNDLPENFGLVQNFPNPFNPSTTIQFTLDNRNIGDVDLVIFNSLGRKVRTLSDQQFLRAGQYNEQWDGTNDAGKRVSSGTYYYRLSTPRSNEIKSMSLIQ